MSNNESIVISACTHLSEYASDYDASEYEELSQELADIPFLEKEEIETLKRVSAYLIELTTTELCDELAEKMRVIVERF